MPWTYILRCSDDSYYVGSTVDLEGRIWQHNSDDLGALYTRRRRPVELAWCTWFARIDDAFAYEKRIQGWSRKKREALINEEYDALPDLSRRAAVQLRAAEEADDAEAPGG
ncbi:GIY-YIG nuclease family protein [Nocardioides sp. WS12]|uniref:GIY-YIG nuclease family protein n=1 Tax=Nocardioides sp. WS12 TaxID=2486272 RepID=UPI0015F7D066|nr:GIY-YIG nuclease family protein [Nocardioides sp. WS12]